MKKLLSTIAIIIAFSAAYAQDTHDIICLRTGFNLARHIDASKSFSKIKFGINAGLTVDFEIFNNFFARPGIMFSMKGARYDKYETVENLNYFELPLLVAYKINITNNIVADFQTGAFLAGGAFGMIKRKETDSEFRAFKRYDNLEYRRFDVGLNFGVGVIFKKHYYFGFGYDLSLRLLHERDFKYNVPAKNGCSMINIGYYL
ncbi:MAG: PorT family protein [Bacteroidales bacterium]|nr:PorT family protein [Bacteroidales bacterium]